MGKGSGALRFCGRQNYQLIVSRRAPGLKARKQNPTNGDWGFTIVHRLIEDAKDTAGHKDAEFQDLVLTVHHCYMHLLMNTACYKTIENHLGVGLFKNQTVAPGPTHAVR